jgi:hypothetical protein
MSWTNIKNWEGMYQVSREGEIKSVERMVERSDGRKQPIKESVIKGDFNNCGYRRVRLMRPGYIRRVFVHRIVAETFIPNPENLPCINHKNGLKWDNRVENLEWSDYPANVKHSYDTGLHVHAVGSDWWVSKLTEADVLEIRYRATTEDITQQKLGDEYGVSRKAIAKVIERKTWRHI